MSRDSQVWRAHCLHMAAATHALADRCDDPEMLGAYLALAAKWISAADRPPMETSADLEEADQAIAA